MSSAEVRIKLLADIAGAIAFNAERLPLIPLTGFAAIAGKSYVGDIMFIGRATNGWRNQTDASLLSSREAQDAFARTVHGNSLEPSPSGSPCPLMWVQDHWGSLSYPDPNTKKSPFWRTAKMLMSELGIVPSDSTEWPSKLAWSNLYKVAPKIGGNPGDYLKSVQRNQCAELLMQEIADFKPKLIVFVTGLDWAERFLDSSAFTLDSAPLSNGTVQAAGSVSIGGAVSGRFVVAVRPDRRKEQAWVQEVAISLRATNREVNHFGNELSSTTSINRP